MICVCVIMRVSWCLSLFLLVYLCSGTRLHSAHPQLLTVQMSPLCAFALPDQIFCVCVSPRKLHNPNLLCVCVCVSQRGMSKEAKARVHICSNLPFQLSSIQPPLCTASRSTQNCKHLVEKTASILITLVPW